MPHTVVLFSAVQQSESAMHVPISPLWGFPSHLGHYGPLSRVPCAVQPVLNSWLSIHSISSVHMSISISQFTPLHPPWCPYVCSTHLCLYFCNSPSQPLRLSCTSVVVYGPVREGEIILSSINIKKKQVA